MTPNGDITEVTPYLTSAATIAFAQKWLKSFAWYQNLVKELPIADKWIHRGIALVGSVSVAVGIHITFTGSLMTGYDGTFHIPNIMTMLHGASDVAKVFALQQMSYNIIKERPF